MHHHAKLSFGKNEQLPYRAECACGTAGDFASYAEARNYVVMHLTRLQGINSSELTDETVAPLPVPGPEAPAGDVEQKQEEPQDEADNQKQEGQE